MNKHFGCFALLSFCLLAGPRAEQSAVIDASRVNVRGKPTLRSEVVTQLVRGDKVVILEEIPDTDAKKNEPSTWARIKLPENTPVWVFAPFVKDGEVSVSRLNLRAGPGENYSVVGRVEKGDKIKPIRTVESWIEIEAPEDTYAYVALSLLKPVEGQPADTAADTEQTPAAQPVAANAAPEPTPAQPAPAAQTPSVATAPDATPSPEQPAPAEPQETVAGTPESPAPATAEQGPEVAQAPDAAATGQETPAAVPQPQVSLPPVAEPVVTAEEEKELPRRVVRREGIVRPTRSIQAPTPFALVHPETGTTINYLYGADIGVNLAEFRDFKVVVTGQEGLDARWPNTPVLQLESIDTAP